MASKKLKALFHLLKEMLEGEKTYTAKQSREPNQRNEAILQPRGTSLLPPERKSEQPSNQGDQFFGDIPENTDQFDLKSGSSNPLDIVVGVDFGTSSTKVVVRAPLYTGNPAFAVPFGGLAHKSLEYLLPTRLFVDKDGLCSINSMPGASTLTDIKLGLMQAPLRSIEPASGPSCDAPAITVATAYLALVLRYARCWFISNKRAIFGEFLLNWSWNLGLPAAIDDDPKLREAFNTSGKAAWLVSRRTGPITIAATQDAINDIECSRYEFDCAFDLIPEVIAEVTGYARSRFRNEGLHLLVDIGASTLDVCSFDLHTNLQGDDHFSILTADVDLLGAIQLHWARIAGAEEAVIAHAATLLDESDPGSVIPDNITDYVPPGQEADQEIYDKLVTAEKAFEWECEKRLRRSIGDLRIRRAPHSPCWSRTLPVFICGGAKDIQTYMKVVSDVHKWLPTYVAEPSNGIRQIDLPKPETLDAEIDDESYHRLAVAWGLSHESFNFDGYTRPEDIDDVPPPDHNNWEVNYIDKDVV